MYLRASTSCEDLSMCSMHRMANKSDIQSFENDHEEEKGILTLDNTRNQLGC
jgi:hypothetical protein